MTLQRCLPVAALLAILILPTPAAAAATVAHAPARAQFYPSPEPTLKDLPFSEAVRAGDLLIVSGEIGALPGKMMLAPGGIGPEARQAIENIRDILQRHGATLRDVVQCTAYLADMKDWPAFNAAYREYFKPPFPARSAVGVNGLALGARLELQCTAYAPGTHAAAAMPKARKSHPQK